MHISKSLAALVAAASLGGGALALVAPAAQANVPGIDVTGTVTAGGAPAADVFVAVYDANPDGSRTFIDDATTDAAGQFSIDFDADGVTSTQPSIVLDYFKPSDVRGRLDLQEQYSGNQPTLHRAVPVTKSTTGPTLASINLPVQAGVQGTVTVPAPAGYEYTGTVLAYDADGRIVDSAGFDNDPTNDASDPLDDLGTYEFRDLNPGQSYRFLFSAFASETTPATAGAVPNFISYVGSFYGDVATLEDAKSVPTTAGQFVTGINGTLTNVLTATEKPSVKGQVAPGKTVKADPGTWTRNSNTTYSYQWLLNGKLVSTDDSYKIPKKHSVKKKLQLVVTAQNFDNAGTVALPATKIKYASKLKTKAKAVYVDGKRVVQIKGALKVKGVKKKKLAEALKGIKITVYEVSKSDDTVMKKVGKAKVKNGDVLVTVKGLITGKHYLEVDLKGKKVAEIIKTLKVRV